MKFLILGLVAFGSLTAFAGENYSFKITKKIENTIVQDASRGLPLIRDMTVVLTDGNNQNGYDYNQSTIISCGENKIYYRNQTSQKATVNLFIPVQGTGSRGRPCSKLELCLNHMANGESIMIEANKASFEVIQITVPASCIGVVDTEWQDYSDENGFGKYRLAIQQAELL